MRINHLLPELILQQLRGLGYFYRPRKPVAKDVLGYLRGKCCGRNELRAGLSGQRSLCLKVKAPAPDLEQEHVTFLCFAAAKAPRCPQEGQGPGTWGRTWGGRE